MIDPCTAMHYRALRRKYPWLKPAGILSWARARAAKERYLLARSRRY